MKSRLTPEDYHSFLIHLLFGTSSDAIDRCVSLAYRDLNRTIHGFGKHERRDRIFEGACQLLKHSLINVTDAATCSEFDDWHRTTCLGLVNLFVPEGQKFFIGQAQKWINMSFKYIYTHGEKLIPGYQPIYAFCHVPFDNILLEALKSYDFPDLNVNWSRIDDYDYYLDRQQWIRDRFNYPPLDVEFYLWSRKPLPGEQQSV